MHFLQTHIFEADIHLTCMPEGLERYMQASFFFTLALASGNVSSLGAPKIPPNIPPPSLSGQKLLPWGGGMIGVALYDTVDVYGGIPHGYGDIW